MRFKVLAVDFHIPRNDITNVSFYNAPSFSDYDVVAIDPINVSDVWENVTPEKDGSLSVYSESDAGFSKKLVTIMERRAEETKLLLEKTGGIVVCFLRQKGPILNYKSYYHEYTRFIHRYSWLPSREYSHWEENKKSRKIDCIFSSQYFDPVPRVGQEIGEIDKTHPFSQYFIALKKRFIL